MGRLCTSVRRTFLPGCRRASGTRGTRPDKSDLAMGPLRILSRYQRSPARLVLGLAHRSAAPSSKLRRDDRRLHTGPNPFWGGVLFPATVFGILYLWPVAERRLTKDQGVHNLLDRPRDKPIRTATGAALFVWVATDFYAGAADRAFVQFGIPYQTQIWIYRGAVIFLPAITWILVKRTCDELRNRDGYRTERWRRNAQGGFEPDQPPPAILSGEDSGSHLPRTDRS